MIWFCSIFRNIVITIIIIVNIIVNLIVHVILFFTMIELPGGEAPMISAGGRSGKVLGISSKIRYYIFMIR